MFISFLHGPDMLLKTRHVSLPGAEPYPTLESLPFRFLNLKFTAALALTLKDIRRNYIDAEELARYACCLICICQNLIDCLLRISKLEMLDEVEELDLVLEHYAITWSLSLSGTGLKAPWGDWGLKRKQQQQYD